jgi:hypothetical protein
MVRAQQYPDTVPVENSFLQTFLQTRENGSEKATEKQPSELDMLQRPRYTTGFLGGPWSHLGEVGHG